jgi:hemerythrin-like metal-binding protein
MHHVSCDAAVIGSLAVLQSAFPAMPMPEGVASLIDAGLRRVPGVAAARLTIRLEPIAQGSGAVQDPTPASTRRIWVDTACARYGWLDVVIDDARAFDPYEPYVHNLINDVGMHVESAYQRSRLERALASVSEADRRKDEFLGMLSHELRNPLAPIRSSIYLLEHAAPGSEQARRAREVIRRQTEHLSRLVDDLLDAKRLSTGKFRLHPIRLELVRHVRDAVDDMRALFMSRQVHLELAEPREPAIWINGDATRIAQIVTNLLHNASKFTNPGGHVVVSVERKGGFAHLNVRDDGVGVAPELVPQVFEPFVQGEKTLHRSRGGLGLGLSLVRGIAELHGGSVSARSEGVGKGTEFLVSLPTADPPVASAPPLEVPRRGVRRRILLVEDNRDAAETLRDVLELTVGNAVEIAADGEAGVEAARARPPEVVVCDLGLPGIDGYELARRIRDAPGAERECRLVALSGYAAPEDVERSLRAGFDYHLAKPPDIEELLKLVAGAPGGAPELHEELVTGHHEVDSQHAAILAESAQLRRGGPESIRESLRFLEHHAMSHFSYEEALMEDVGYPRAALHRDQHLAFASELARFKERLRTDGATPETAAALADAVEGWVREHVLDEDRRLADFIRSHDTAVA